MAHTFLMKMPFASHKGESEIRLIEAMIDEWLQSSCLIEVCLYLLQVSEVIDFSTLHPRKTQLLLFPKKNFLKMKRYPLAASEWVHHYHHLLWKQWPHWGGWKKANGKQSVCCSQCRLVKGTKAGESGQMEKEKRLIEAN